MDRYDLVVTGGLLPGAERDVVVQRLATLFKCTPEQASKLVAGRQVTVKSALEREVAERYAQQLTQAGVAVDVRPQQPPAAVPVNPPAVAAPAAPAPGISRQQVVPQVATAAESQRMSCPRCGVEQPAASSCTACGVVIAKFLRAAGNETAPLLAEERPSELEELLDVVGDNIGAYRGKFRTLLDNDGQYTLQWHWPAFFITFPWLFYRRMYLAAAIVALLSFLPFSGVLLLLTLLIPVGGGLFGNYLYFRHCRARVTTLGGRGEERRLALARSGGVMPLPLALFGGVAIMVLVAMLKLKVFYGEELKSAMAAGEQAASVASTVPSGPTGAKMVLMGQMLTLHKLGEVSARRTYTPPADMDEVRTRLQLQPQAINDEWGTAMDYAYSEGKGIFYSAGPDKSFETDDDVVHEVAL